MAIEAPPRKTPAPGQPDKKPGAPAPLPDAYHDAFKKGMSVRKKLAVAGATIVLATTAVASAFGIVSRMGAGPEPSGTPGATDTLKPSQIPSPSATLKDTPLPSPTEKPTPITAGFVQNPDGGIVWHGTNESGVEVDLGVPDLSKYGLKAELEADQTVIYVDAKGARAGEFNPYVSEQQADGSEQQTGAVDLIPSYVSKIMQDKINSIPNQADKWIIPVPLAGATKDSNVKIKYIKNVLGVEMAEVDFNGNLNLTIPFLKSKQINVAQNAVYGMSLFDAYRIQSVDNTTNIKPGEEAHYVEIDANFKDFTGGKIINSSFGDKACQTQSPAYLAYSNSTNYFPVDESKVFHVAPDKSIPSAPEVPVFLDEAV